MSESVNTEIQQQSLPGEVDWDDFRVFVEVVKIGSFNRAAGHLNMTQPTVSRRLARLEEVIGCKLFDRDRRGPRLTPEGQRIYTEARAAQSALIRAATTALRETRAIEGSCNILMGDGVASYWMPRFVSAFFTRNPTIELKVFGTQDGQADRENFDIAVHYVRTSSPDMESVQIGSMHFVPGASKEYLAKHGIPRDLSDLEGHWLLDSLNHLSASGSWPNWIQNKDLHAMLLTNRGIGLAEAARFGGGIAILPTYIFALHDNLVPLDIGVHTDLPLVATYKRETVKTWPVRLALEFLQFTVFDRRNMPWFQDNYVAPETDWVKKMDGLLVRASAAPPPPIKLTAA
jgi:DNA-binding transcriptional LysR family regulator